MQYLVTYLAAGLNIGVNARHSRYIAAVKVGVWYRVENWVVYSGPARHLAQVLSLVLPAQLRLSAIYHLSLLQPISYNYMPLCNRKCNVSGLGYSVNNLTGPLGSWPRGGPSKEAN